MTVEPDNAAVAALRSLAKSLDENTRAMHELAAQLTEHREELHNHGVAMAQLANELRGVGGKLSAGSLLGGLLGKRGG